MQFCAVWVGDMRKILEISTQIARWLARWVSMGMLLGEQMGDYGQGAEPSEAFLRVEMCLTKTNIGGILALPNKQR